MFRNLLSLLRMAAGIALFLIGLIGIFVPLLQGWFFILIAIPLISPEYGRKMLDKIEPYKQSVMLWWKTRKNRR